MCGICGVVSKSALGSSSRNAVTEMNARLVHRGPDSEGRFSSDNAELAMRRLAIVDLAGGRQPFVSDDGQVVLVCNGEIYNHAELRRSLQSAGHHFRSESDVETILHAYRQHGIACLNLLRGMFSFALLDLNAGRFFLVRDRMGEKPLYTHVDAAGCLWFSSELRSLRHSVGASAVPTAESVNLFLTFQYVPEPSEVLAGIGQLEAGHVLEFDLDSGAMRRSPYWQAHELVLDPGEASGRVSAALDSACALMGTADVPVAVALSGGIDSSLVAAFAARHHRKGLRAFTIGYRGRPSTDERSHAAELASYLGIDFTEVEIADEEVVASFPALVSAMDTPIADIAAYGYFAVSRAAREHGYPVLLSGMGGDELFWGYSWVREAMMRNESVESRQGWRYLWARLRGRVSMERDFFGVHSALRSGNLLSREIMSREVRTALPEDLWLRRTALGAERPLHLEVTELLGRTWLRSNCLALVDRMSMAHSVEVRLPLLDVKLVEEVLGMRNAGLDDWRRPHKALLIEALEGVLPRTVLDRPKRGFTPPVARWMDGIVSQWGSLVENGALVRSGLIDGAALVQRFRSVDRFLQYKLVLLECWLRIHVEGEPAESLTGSAAGLAA